MSMDGASSGAEIGVAHISEDDTPREDVSARNLPALSYDRIQEQEVVFRLTIT